MARTRKTRTRKRTDDRDDRDFVCCATILAEARGGGFTNMYSSVLYKACATRGLVTQISYNFERPARRGPRSNNGLMYSYIARVYIYQTAEMSFKT